MKTNGKKYVIARQIDPEHQWYRWEELKENEIYNDLIVTGNTSLIGKTTNLYDRIISLLEIGVENIEDVEYVFDELTTDEKEQIVQMYQEYYKDENEFIMRVLEIITGEVWYHNTILGYSQGDWQECFHTEEMDIDYIEQVYFRKEDEFEISKPFDEMPEDISDGDYCGGWFVPHHERNVKEILHKYVKENFIADNFEVKIYLHDGYDMISRYRELE